VLAIRQRHHSRHQCHDGVASVAGDAAAVDAATELNPGAKEPKLQCLPSGRGATVVTNDHDGVASAAGDAAAVDAASELNPRAKEPKLQCLPSGRGATVVTSDHDGVASAAGDAAAVDAAAELNLLLVCIRLRGRSPAAGPPTPRPFGNQVASIAPQASPRIPPRSWRRSPRYGLVSWPFWGPLKMRYAKVFPFSIKNPVTNCGAMNHPHRRMQIEGWCGREWLCCAMAPAFWQYNRQA
jgi:hypothetical protein